MTNIRLCVETGLAFEHDKSHQPKETHSQDKAAFGFEYKTKQMASPSNNILQKLKIREKQHKQLANLEGPDVFASCYTPLAKLLARSSQLGIK